MCPPAAFHRLCAPAAHPERGGGLWGAGLAGTWRLQLSHVPGSALPGEAGDDAHCPLPLVLFLVLICVPTPQNGGICEDAESSTYICRCPQGFTGSNCEYSQALHCHPGGCLHHRDIACCPLGAGIPRAHLLSLSPLSLGRGMRARCHLHQPARWAGLQLPLPPGQDGGEMH